MTAPYAIRSARDTDQGFIVDSWRNSFAPESQLCAFDRDVYFRLMAKEIGGILRDPRTTALVACDHEDDDALLGFAVLTGPELHYVYVRGGRDVSVRKLGIVRAMLEGRALDTYSFRTQAGVRRLKPDARGWTYRPRTVAWGEGKFHVEIAA